jgi:acetyl-CoA C-acetyltransferase
VGIVGVGQTNFHRIRMARSIREACFEAFKEAVDDAGVDVKDIDGVVVCYTEEYDKQRGPWSPIAEYLGLIPRPVVGVSNYCASSSMGVRVAWALIKSGLHSVVAVIGYQKMTELTGAEVQEKMIRGGDLMWETPFGIGMPHVYACFARRHMHEYGTTEEQLALVRVKSSEYGYLNPKAAFREKVTVDQVLKSPPIAWPLKLFDCCANADGASCVILAREDIAKRVTDTPVWILGLGACTESNSIAGRESFVTTGSWRAAEQAYKMAGVEPKDIDVAEVHDCFTIAEIMAYEDLGFCPRGEGGKLIEEGQTYIGGRIPVNVDGGLLSKGHPVGATGGSQIRTITLQLRNEAYKIHPSVQVHGAEVGLIHNVGGTGHCAAVTILGRD